MMLNEMEIFCYVVELKSFTRAASRLGVSKSYVSKRITKLEDHLKTKLLARSPRQLTLTEAGKTFYQYCSTIVNEADKAEQAICAFHDAPSGILTVGAPPAFGVHVLSKILPAFQNQYPDITVNLELENKVVDLLREGYDLVLRSAKLPDSNLIAQKIGMSHNIVCGTPAYFKKHGQPKRPDDLDKHSFCLYNYAKDRKQWTFKGKNEEVEVVLNSIALTNQIEMIKQLVLKDMCLGVLPSFMMIDEIKNGDIIHCLSDYKLVSHELFAVYPDRDYLPPKVRVFIAALKKYIGDNPEYLL